MRLVLHVGAHKTGTSLIQRYFRDRPTSRRQPQVAVIPRRETNQLIAWGRPLLDDPMRLRRRLEAERRNAPSALLVSHENSLGRPLVTGMQGIYPGARERIEALAEISAGFDTCIVLYVRPVDEFIESLYLQTVQEGSAVPFPDWYSALDPAWCSWTPTVQALHNAFPGRVVVGDFREIRNGQTKFLRSFMARTGIPQPRVVLDRRRLNPSISSEGLRLALARNAGLETPEQRRRSRLELQRSYSNLDGARPALLTPDQRAELREFFADEYRALLTGIQPDAPAVSRRMSYAIPLPRVDDRTPARTLDLVDGVGTPEQSLVQRSGLAAYRPETAPFVLTVAEMLPPGSTILLDGFDAVLGAVLRSLFDHEVVEHPVDERSSRARQRIAQANGHATPQDSHGARPRAEASLYVLEHTNVTSGEVHTSFRSHRPFVVFSEWSPDDDASVRKAFHELEYSLYPLRPYVRMRALGTGAAGGTRHWLASPRGLGSRFRQRTLEWQGALRSCHGDRNPPLPPFASTRSDLGNREVIEALTTGVRNDAERAIRWFTHRYRLLR